MKKYDIEKALYGITLYWALWTVICFKSGNGTETTRKASWSHKPVSFNKEWKEVGYKRTVINQVTLYFTGEAFYHLDAPVIRVTGVDTPMPYTKSLEAAALPQPHDIVRAVKRVLNVKW